MSNTVLKTYEHVINDVFENIDADLTPLKKLWMEKVLNRVAVMQKRPKLKRVLRIDDKYPIAIKITVPKNFRGQLKIHNMKIKVPRFVVRHRLIRKVFFVKDILNILDIERDLAMIALQLLVDDRCKNLLHEYKKVDEQIKAVNAGLKDSIEYDENLWVKDKDGNLSLKEE